jgi:hypothetical protein
MDEATLASLPPNLLAESRMLGEQLRGERRNRMHGGEPGGGLFGMQPPMFMGGGFRRGEERDRDRDNGGWGDMFGGQARYLH